MNVPLVKNKVIQITGIHMQRIVPVFQVILIQELKPVCHATDFARNVMVRNRKIV